MKSMRSQTVIRPQAQVQHITGIKVLDTILAHIEAARTYLVAKYGVTTLPPDMILKEAYVSIEESKIPRATKYRYKAFLREFAKLVGLGNIRVRKHRFHKDVKKYSQEVGNALKKELTARAQKVEEPVQVPQTNYPEEYEIQKIYDNQEYEEAPEGPAQEEFSEEEYWGPEGYSEPPADDSYNISNYMDWEE